MQFIIILGAVAIAAAVALVYTSKGGAENNSDVTNLLDKLKNFATAVSDPPKQPAAPVDKYEKSDDGKVVYAFKPKGDGDSDNEDGKDA
jgi:hypothetical protein